MLLETSWILINILLSNAQTICKSKYSASNTVSYFQRRYMNIFKEKQQEKSYNVSDKYKWIKYFNYELPCGTKEYYYGMPIINGTEAPEKSWPWQVLLYFSTSYCGGVLIDYQWVLTAAHCVKNRDITVYLGTRYRDFRDYQARRSAIVVAVHDEYDNETFDNDIALLKLNTPVAFTEEVRPACLPTNKQEFSLNDRCFVTGYGERRRAGENTLQQLREYVVPDVECFYLYQTLSANRYYKNICVGRVRQNGGTCLGDSGGPLSCEIGHKYYVAGILSTIPNNCISDIVPDAYTKVSEYINWIFHTIESS